MKIYVVTFLAAWMCVSSLYAENSITQQLNFYRPGDIITKQQVAYIEPGLAGKKLVWNFARQGTINEKCRQFFFQKFEDNQKQIVIFDNNTFGYLELKNDTLWMTGYKNNTMQMDFDRYEAQLKYPFQFGDSVVTSFHGKGKYCDKINARATGSTIAKADGQGTLITPTGDTLFNVIRVRRMRSYTETGKDSVNLQLETFSWYAGGYRYPVFETIMSNLIHGDSITRYSAASFYFPLTDMQELANDPENLAIRNENQNPDQNAGTEMPIVKCKTHPNPIENELIVSYELLKDAQVAYRISNLSGIAIVSRPAQPLRAGKQREVISMSGYPSGSYLLYIMVNDNPYKITIIKK